MQIRVTSQVEGPSFINLLVSDFPLSIPGSVLHSFMMATTESLTARDNVAAIRALENATMRVAQERRFLGVFTTNTSPLTQVTSLTCL